MITKKQLDNLIRKHSETGQEHPAVRCRFCGQPVEPGTGEIEAVLTRRKTLIVFHAKCYNYYVLGKECYRD